MLKIKLNLTPNVFLNKFKQIKHKYPTAYASNNFVMPQKQLKRGHSKMTSRKNCQFLRPPLPPCHALSQISYHPLYATSRKNYLYNESKQKEQLF